MPARHAITDAQEVNVMTTRHSDFERIHAEFIKYYGAKTGDEEYYAWIKALNLDETKSYAFSQREKFSFIKPMLARLKEDKDNVYYKVLVGFPIVSMNDNLYTQSKLSAAAGGLVDAFDCNLNHEKGLVLPGVRYAAAKFEDGAVEAVLKVPRSLLCSIDVKAHSYEVGSGRPLFEWIDEGVIYNQSLEANEYPEFHFEGSALLTKDTLPGIPLSKIYPLEHVLSEALSASKSLKAKTLKIQVKGLNSMSEAHQCPVGQHWDENKGACVPDEGTGKTPEGTSVSVGDNVGDDSKKPVEKIKALEKEIERLKTNQSAQVISSLNVAKTQAESKLEELKLTTAAQIESAKNEAAAKVKGAELAAATAEKQFIEESKLRQKAEGRVEELEKQVDRLEKQATENNKRTIQDGSRIKDLERRLADAMEKQEQFKDENEKLAKKCEETDAKYRDMLKKNGDLSKELTAANEELLNTSQKAEQLDKDLKKAKRLAKITVNM
jgi:hypothetical protein